MAGRVYTADPSQERTAVPLESLVAVYHARSGMTHLLAPPASEILEALGQGPGDADAILARLEAQYEMTGSGFREAISARLEELEASGLVQAK